jgi:NADH:ubiquinone oxidoreductase subunit C
MTAETAPVQEFDREAYRSVRARTKELIDNGARMITIVARENDDGTIELIYIFDHHGRMVNFRFTILPEWEVDSVVDIHKGAMNMEREVVDLFGLRYKGVQPGLLLVQGKSAVAPLRKKRAPEVKGGESDG